MKIKIIDGILIIIFCIFIGCISNKPEYTFPSDIRDQCNNALNQSLVSIEKCGTKLAKPKKCYVVKHKGEKKIGRMWCWYDTYWRSYVGGLCSGNKIEIGCNPSTLSEVMYEVINHEFGHYWLLGIGVRGHPPIYKNYFYNWFDIKKNIVISGIKDKNIARDKLEEISDLAENGTWVSVDGMDGDKAYHIDFVVIKE